MTLAFIDVGPTPAPSAVTATANNATVVSSSGASAGAAECACSALDATVVVSIGLVQFDLLPSSPFPIPGDIVQPAQALTRSTSAFPATTLYVGLIVADSWVPSHAYTLGQYVTVGNPNMFATTDRTIKICTTAGTSGATEPTWNQTPGGTTSDGGAGWTETSLLFNAGTLTGVEPSDTAYARGSFDNSVTIFYQDTVTLNPTIRFPTSTTAWGNIVGIFVADAPTGGNIYAWGLIPVGYAPASGKAPCLTLGPPWLSPAVVLVEKVIVDFNTVAAASQTITIPNVVAGDVMIVLAVLSASIVNFSTPTPTATSTGAGSPTWHGVAGTYWFGPTLGIAWWYAVAPASGTYVITITPASSDTFGLWGGLLANAGTPTGGAGTAGNSPSISGGAKANVLVAGSWMTLASFSVQPQINRSSSVQFDVGPRIAGVQNCGLMYGMTDPDYTGTLVNWTTLVGGLWETVGIIVPPA